MSGANSIDEASRRLEKTMPVKARIEQAKWMRVFIPLIVLTLYFAALSRFLHWLLPGYGTSVNAVFADNAWKVSLALAVLYVIFFVLLKLPVIFERYVFAVDEPLKKRIRNALAFESKNRIEKLDWILILLPLTPTVQYILNNQDILSPLGSLYVFAVLAAFSVIPIFVVPTSLRATGSTKTLMILGMAFAFTITNMASLSAQMHWLERGILVTQLFVLGAVLTVGWVLYNLIGRKSVYLLIGIFFVANSVLAAVAAAPNYTAETMPDLQDSGNELMRLVGSEKPLSTPNIYLLIYDAYVANETMVGYGIDNGAQEEYLETMGFRIYPHTYSIGPDTLDTMSRVFNASTEFYGSPRRAVSGDGVVQNLLKRFGYETCYVSWSDYVFQGIGSSWDFSFPRAPSPSEGLSCHELVTKSIFMGEFRFDVSFDTVPRNQYLQLASSVFRDVPEEPRFVYMHHDWPNHSQLSGVCRPDETARYENKLFWANLEMKQHVEEIIHNDPGAIVVVAGDHGPYLTKNCTTDLSGYDAAEISRLDIQSRYGTFLAIRWPTDDFSEYDEIVVLQDVFPAVFAYMFRDRGFLEAKVEARTLMQETVGGVKVDDGVIRGGMNDGEPLFVDQR